MQTISDVAVIYDSIFKLQSYLLHTDDYNEFKGTLGRVICQKITQFLKFVNLELLMVLIIDTKSRISPWESRLCLSSVFKVCLIR